MREIDFISNLNTRFGFDFYAKSDFGFQYRDSFTKTQEAIIFDR